MLDAADGGVDDQAAGKARGVVHHVEEVLDIARIIADQPRFEVFDDLNGRFVRSGGIGLTDAVDPLVGEHFYVHPVASARADQERFDIGDLHRGRVPDLAPIQREQTSAEWDRSSFLRPWRCSTCRACGFLGRAMNGAAAAVHSLERIAFCSSVSSCFRFRGYVDLTARI